MGDADFGSKFTHQVYEVLSEDTKKYTSTTVGGGGGSVMGSGGYVSGSTNAVTSRVDYHSDQSVWVKNVDTGKERKFQLNTFNIDVRPGHKVLCVWDRKADILERVVNLNTGDISYANGIQHFYAPKTGSFFTWIKSVFYWLIIAFFTTMPFLSIILLGFGVFHIFRGKGHFFNREKFPTVRPLGVLYLCMGIVLTVLSFYLPHSTAKHFSDTAYSFFWPLFFLIVFISQPIQLRIEIVVKRKRIHVIEEYTSNLVKELSLP